MSRERKYSQREAGGMKEGECCLVFAGTAQSDSQDNWSYYYSQSLASVRFLSSQSNLICTWTSLNRSLSFMSQKILNWVGSQNVLSCLFLNSLAFPTQMQKQYAPVESRPWKPAHPAPTPHSRRAAPRVWTCSSSPWVPETLLCPTGG